MSEMIHFSSQLSKKEENDMAEEQKEQKMTSFIDSTFKLTEMYDELDVKIKSIDTIIAKQAKLIAVLEAAKDKELDDVIAQMKEKLETYTKGNNAQKYRKDCIAHILGILQHSNDINLRFAISMLLEATALVNPEGLPIEQRSDYDEPAEEQKSENKENA